MNLLIVPKPLFNSEMAVEGYLMASQFGNAILESTRSNPLDRAMDSPLIDFMNEVGLTALTQDKPIFIPITHIQLVTDLTRNIREDSSKIVFVLNEKVTPDDLVLKRCDDLSQAGYRFAAYFTGDMEYIRAFSRHISFVFLRVPLDTLISFSLSVSREFPRLDIIATDLGDKALVDEIITTPHSRINLFDGAFYKVHIDKKDKKPPCHH